MRHFSISPCDTVWYSLATHAAWGGLMWTFKLCQNTHFVEHQASDPHPTGDRNTNGNVKQENGTVRKLNAGIVSAVSLSPNPSVKPHPHSQRSCDASRSLNPLRFPAGSSFPSSASRSAAWSCWATPGSWVRSCGSCLFAGTHKHRCCTGLQRAAAKPGWLWLKDKNSRVRVNPQRGEERGFLLRYTLRGRRWLKGCVITLLEPERTCRAWDCLQ